MSAPLHFSRLTLRRDAADIAPLLQVLQPSKSSDRLAVDHRLIWTVIPPNVRTEVEQSRTAGTPKSAFLWRADRQRGRYYLLGPKPLEDSPFFAIETKPFEPTLSLGRISWHSICALTLQLIGKVLAGRSGNEPAVRQRCDVAMDLAQGCFPAHAGMNPSTALESRMQLAEKAAYDWLMTRATEAYGFHLDAAEARRLSSRAFRTARWEIRHFGHIRPQRCFDHNRA